ncbi:hypothetical protein SCHPADRAFT_855233 [Schizopora paradoxa]|uniref:Uncharacterized protein n=1 Tax=Schizopora paradoxa TaxID=27342 RepID=A0A0H2S3I5_9AGAM|nr:hypothetical protein SCHPADRAFT_855233 [Schizopora paradoxa]
MAQAVYDSHPLQEYLEETDLQSLTFPGAFVFSPDDEDVGFEGLDLTWVPPNVLHFLENLHKAFVAIRSSFPATHNDLAERFKYDLISSTLLSSAVPATPLLSHVRPRPASPDSPLPGQLSSTPEDDFNKTEEELKMFSSAFAFLGIAAALSQYRFVAILAFIASYASMRSYEVPPSPSQYPAQIYQALQDLKDAGSNWDASINECMSALDREERGSFLSNGGASTSSNSNNPSPLRLALHSTLLTTHTQCDNVRPLLAALASPSELSQLSEMYAPPSPAKQSFSVLSPQLPRRPFSLSESAVYTPPSSAQSFSGDKRQTWNGSYMSLADFNTRSSPVLRKKNWRRSDLSSLMEGSSSSSSIRTSRTNPSSPQPPLSPLSSLQEADDESNWHENENEIEAESTTLEVSKDNFGTAALLLRRRRRTRGSVALGFPSSRSVPSLRSPSHSPSSSSKFTSFQPTRHPLSVSALHNTLDGAVAARRYACAHLLALRFDEDAEDESYWDNVKSVMSLLTTTLEDASARLCDALAESEQQQSQMAQPSPLPSPLPSFEQINDSFLSVRQPEGSMSPSSAASSPMLVPGSHSAIPLSPLGIQSFAPMPSGLSRFGGHVDTISGALGEASSHLRELVSSLQDPVSEQRHERSSSERATLDHLEKLRRELGLALRECERGKASLIDHFEARRRRSSLEYSAPDSESDEEGVTLIGGSNPDRSSGSSAEFGGKLDESPVTPDEGSPILPSLSTVLAGSYDEDVNAISSLGRDVDDVTQHLLDSTSASVLPPPGIEQVFEAEPVVVQPFTMERSKLSREERIKLQKAKRASFQSRIPTPFGSNAKASRFATFGLGPGADVVDELKDVIWKVGEKRRRLKEAAAVTSLETIQDDCDDTQFVESGPTTQLKPSMRLA